MPVTAKQLAINERVVLPLTAKVCSVQTLSFKGMDRSLASNRLNFWSQIRQTGSGLTQVCTPEQLKAHLTRLIGQSAQPMNRVQSSILRSPTLNPGS
jgi:hypothetical protein